MYPITVYSNSRCQIIYLATAEELLAAIASKKKEQEQHIDNIVPFKRKEDE